MRRYSDVAAAQIRENFVGETDEKGYVIDPDDNLLAGVERETFWGDLEQGDGGETRRSETGRRKIDAVHSSAMLAANAFAPWKKAGVAPWLPGIRGGDGRASDFRFEGKCPIRGIRSRKSPNLDLLVEGPDCVVAVESKYTEHLNFERRAFRDQYVEKLPRLREYGEEEWLGFIEHPDRLHCRFLHLDVPQLVRHYLGILSVYGNAVERGEKQIVLAYAYWEPEPRPFDGTDEHVRLKARLNRHRMEVREFAACVAAAKKVRFLPVCYRDLWPAWESRAEPDWLPDHARNLRARYSIPL